MAAKFVALGGVWLDEICAHGKEPLEDVPGGSVAFATFGACIFSAQSAQDIGLIVKAGHDFPESLLQTFTEWQVNLHVIRLPSEPSARGRVIYGNSASERVYRRLTSPLQSTPQDIADAGLLGARCLHFFDTAGAVGAQLNELVRLRASHEVEQNMLVVWEPQARSCSPNTFEEHKELLESGQVNVFSPNHAELQQFFSSTKESDISFDRAIVEHQARAFLPSLMSSTIESQLCILIRCAEHGCFVLSTSSSGQVSAWLPSFYGSGKSHYVVDPTGAGNAFLGGLAMGYLETADYIQAAKYGSVAASFAVEVIGLPHVGRCDARGRLEEYKRMSVDES